MSNQKKKAKKELLGSIPLAIIFTIYLFYQQIYGLAVVFLAITLGLILYWKYDKKQKQDYFNSRGTLNEIRSLTPDNFEEYIVHLYNLMGYNAEKVGGSHDGGIDVIAEKNGKKHYIQCKKFINRKVTLHDVRDFYGAITDRLSDSKAIFITTNIFTTEAEQFCEDKPIELIDGNKLMGLLKKNDKIQDKIRSLECPDCEGRLVERNGKHGKFLGCSNYPKCKYTMDYKNYID